MILYSIILAVVCLANFAHSKAIDLPLFEKPCPRSAENYVECFMSTFQESWPRIVEGIPELNIPPLDPLIIEEISDKIEFGPIQGKFRISNAAVYGMLDTKLLSMDSKIEDNHLHLELEFSRPKEHQEADYDVEGSFNDFIVSGKGHANISMTDVTAVIVMDGPIMDDRWHLETIKLTPKIGDMKFWASDLFNGNKALTEALLVFINENWKDLYKFGLDIMQPLVDKYLKDFINKILAEVPISQVFPQ